jgi:hypothetical protein
MKSETKTDFHRLIDSLSLLPVAVGAGYLLNAFYQALILKKLSGETITPEIEEQVRQEVIREHDRILRGMMEGEEMYQLSGKLRPA